MCVGGGGGEGLACTTPYYTGEHSLSYVLVAHKNLKAARERVGGEGEGRERDGGRGREGGRERGGGGGGLKEW